MNFAEGENASQDTKSEVSKCIATNFQLEGILSQRKKKHLENHGSSLSILFKIYESMLKKL